MSFRDRFYDERDARTRAYGVDPVQLETPVGIVVGSDAAESPAGQAAVLALVNLISRVHRKLHVWVPDTELRTRALVRATTLAEACAGTALSIDPYQEQTVQDVHQFDAAVPSIAIGERVPDRGLIYAGGDGFIGIVDRKPVSLSERPTSTFGMGLGVCLAAGELFRSVFGQSTRCRRVSAWDFDDGDDATVGPTVEPKPLDVGDVAVVGAGAVGSAFCYWAAQLGHTGRWTVIDQDKVELHNTNRCMGLVATDAGWPDGQPSGMPVSKAQAAARLVIADSYDGWYHDWLETCSERPDLVLPLANEFGVRHAIGQRAEPIIVHATTSANWTAELHRHIAGRDDCIDCRLPARSESNFRCSTGLVPAPTETVTPNDAALPFLSGAAGLMLLVALVQLEHGAFAEHRRNHWRLLFGPAERAWSSSTHRCLEECRSQVAPAVRKKVNADRRWAHLDTPTRRSDEL